MSHMINEIFEQPEVLERCLAVNENTLSALARELDTRKIKFAVIAGRGTSDHAGIYFKYLLEIYKGIPASLAAPSAITLYGGKPDMSGCLVVGISQSGRAADVLEVLRLANKQGAVTAAVTNDEKSPLAMAAGYHLFCAAGIEKSVAATKTFTSELYLLGRLAAVWSRSAELSESLDTAIAPVKETLALSALIKQKAEERRDMSECFVLSRGLSFPLASEAALKIAETCYIRANAYSVSDFYHGPFAMVGKGTSAILFALDKKSDSDVFVMYEKLKATGAKALLFTNDEKFALSPDAVILPKSAEGAAGIYAGAAAAQLFACHLSAAKGLDPDNPRGLNKVTITL